MSLCYRLRDGKSEADPAGFLASRSLDAVKWLQDTGEFLFSDPGSLIIDNDLDCFRRGPNGHGRRLSILDGVIEKVVDRALQSTWSTVVHNGLSRQHAYRQARVGHV